MVSSEPPHQGLAKIVLPVRLTKCFLVPILWPSRQSLSLLEYPREFCGLRAERTRLLGIFGRFQLFLKLGKLGAHFGFGSHLGAWVILPSTLV